MHPLRMLKEQESSYAMIPSSRITRENYWCSTDAIFVDEISKLFKQWINRKETPHGSDCDSDRINTTGPVTEHSSINFSNNNYNYNSSFRECQNVSQRNNQICSDIPKKLHFIWLGSDIPPQYNVLIGQWREIHPNWEVKIWDDEDVESLNLRNRSAYLSANNWGMKSDILRYEILSLFGGVYIDIDYECILNIDFLCDKNSFFCGISNTTVVEINNGLMGSVAGHPLLDIMINNITDSNTSKKEKTKENTKINQASLLPAKNTNAIFQNLTNSDFFSSFFTEDENLKISEAKAVKNVFSETIETTGPGMVTKTIYKYLCENKSIRESKIELKNQIENKSESELEFFFREVDENDCSNSNEIYYNRISNITIFPYTVFHPLPNSISTDLNDNINIQKLKDKYVISYAFKNTKNNDDRDGKSDSNAIMKIDKYSSSFALHWWQKSWQEK